MATKRKINPTANAARNVSPSPLNFDEAVTDLLQVPPPPKDKPKRKKAAKKPRTKRSRDR